MAWSRLQSISGSNGTGTTLTATLGSALTNGSKLIAYCMVDGGATLSTVKDGGGNSFSSVASKAASDGSTLTILVLDHPNGSSTAITLTITGTNGGLAMLVQEVSGLAAGSTAAAVLDGTAGLATGSFVNVSSGSATLTAYTSAVASEYLVAVYADNGDGSGSATTTPSGYTADANNVSASADADLSVDFKNSTGGSESPASLSITGLNNSATYLWDTIFVAFKLPGGAAAPNGTVQPRATVPVPRRRPARGLWGGVKGQAFVKVAAPVQEFRLAPRRVPGRAVWRGSSPFTGFVQVPAPRQPPVTVFRRRLARGFWERITGQAFVQVPAPVQQFRTAPRRPLSRAVWRGGQGQAFAAVPAPRQLQLAPRRKPARAVVPFPPPVTVVVAVPVAAPRQLPVFPRRKLARAVVQFRPVATTNAAPPPFVPRGQPPQAPDDKSYIKKLLLLG